MGVRRWRFISPPSRSRRWAATVPTTVSYRSIINQSFGMFAGDSKGQRFQLTSAATLKALCFSNSTNVRTPSISGTLALYADAAGPTPGALIASGQFNYVEASGRSVDSTDVIRVPVAPVALAAGFYWVIFFVTAASGLVLPAHDEVGIPAFSQVVDLQQSPPPPDPFPAVTATPYFVDIFAETKKATGPTTWTGSATLALTDTTTTGGVRKTFGSSITVLTDAITTSVKRKTFGSSVTALTDAITTAGSRKALGQSVVALTDAITTTGRRTTFSSVTQTLLGVTLDWPGSQAGYNTDLDAYISMVGGTPRFVQMFRNMSNPMFSATQMNAIRARGALPLITSEPWADSSSTSDPVYKLSNITRGDFDSFFSTAATDAIAYGQPIYLRWAPEMNGNWAPWGYTVNGNTAADFINAWRHVHDIFTAAGANNVIWVWCPNIYTVGPANPASFAQFYPGDAYVDMLGLDGYNWGTVSGNVWQTWTEVIGFSYDQLLLVNASKKIMVAETASAEAGGDKAAWITSTYGTELASRTPRVEHIVWFNENKETDWRVESSAPSLAAYKNVVAQRAPYYTRITTAGIVSTAQTDSGIVSLKLSPAPVEVFAGADAAVGTLALTPSGTDVITPTVVELGTFRGNSSSLANGSVTVPVAGVAIGHTVILAVCCAGNRTVTAADSRGNAYAVNVTQINGTSLTVTLLSARITTALLSGDTITVTPNTATNFAFGAYDVATLLSPAFDKSASAVGTGVTADSGATVTTTQADELLFAVHGWNATAGTYTVMDNTWARPPTDPLITTVTTIRLMGVEYKNVSATGAYNATGTYSGASTQWAAAIGTYKFGTGVVNSDTGTGILLLSASASDVSDRVDSNTGVLAFSPSSSEVYTPGALIYSDAATGAITFTPSAAEIRERVDGATVPLALFSTTVEAFAGVDSASVPLVFSLTSADVFVGADAATEVFALTPSGTDIVERTGTDAATGIVSLVPLSSEVLAAADSATGTLSLVPSATDAGQRVEVGNVSIVLAASSNDVFVATDSGTSQLALTASAIETTSAAGTDTGIEVFKFTPSASEAAQTTDAATTPVVFLPSGTEFRVVTDANAASLNLTPSAAETQLTVDTATALVTFSPSSTEFFTGVDSATAPVVFLPSSSEGRESVDVAASILALSPGSIDVYERVDVATALLRFTPDSQEAGFIFFDAATVYLSLSGHAILFELSGAMRRIYGARIRHRLGRSGLYRPINSRLSRVYSGGMHD